MAIVRRIQMPSARTMLPLVDIDFDLVVNDTDVANAGRWPPVRFYDRDKRLDLLNALWNGELSALVEYDEDVQLPLNIFRRLALVIADMLMMSEIKAVIDLRAAANQAAIDMIRYGGALYWAGVNVEGEPFVDTILRRAGTRTWTAATLWCGRT